jgi:hypothetical protein
MRGKDWFDLWSEEYRRVAEKPTKRSPPPCRIVWWVLPLAFLVGGAVYGYLMTHPTQPGDPRISAREAQDM